MAWVACTYDCCITMTMTLAKYLDNIVHYIYCNVVVLFLSYFIHIVWTKIETIVSLMHKLWYMGPISKSLRKRVCITSFQITLYTMHYSGIVLCYYGDLQNAYQNTHIVHYFSTFVIIFGEWNIYEASFQFYLINFT